MYLRKRFVLCFVQTSIKPIYGINKASAHLTALLQRVNLNRVSAGVTSIVSAAQLGSPMCCGSSSLRAAQESSSL